MIIGDLLLSDRNGTKALDECMHRRPDDPAVVRLSNIEKNDAGSQLFTH